MYISEHYYKTHLKIQMMNYITINKENSSINIVNSIVQANKSFNLLGSYNNISDALQVIKDKNVDIIFLDAMLENINRLEFIRYLPNSPYLIFINTTTEIINYFKFNISKNYFLPISDNNFLKLFESPIKEPNIEINNSLQNKYLFIKVGSSTVKINHNEIKYIEGLKDYIKIFMDGNKSFITKCTIKYIENKLPKDLFVRTHKSYIVSLAKIDKIEFNHIFIDSAKIPVGMQFKEPFYNLIDTYRL
jgi:DNA-binding LytR/AlgR family response regulator